MTSQQMECEYPHTNKGTILIVDDVKENLRLLNDVLRADGYIVLSALNGALALESAQSSLPDLILLDIKMPGINGYETYVRLKADEKTRDVPVIFLSALNKSIDKVKGLQLGAVDYITKPFDVNEILARVKNHMTTQNRQKKLVAKNRQMKEMFCVREEIEQITLHDLKGPLSSVISFPKYIRNKGILTEQQLKYLATIEKAGNNILNIVNYTTDLLRKKKGAHNTNSFPVDLIQVIEEINNELRDKMEKKRLSLAVHLDSQPLEQGDSFNIFGKKHLCHSMLENLIKNAIEASSNGQSISIFLERNETYDIIIHNEEAVSRGIRDRFFEKYVTAGKAEGTGVGTYAAKLATERQGGKIEMETSDERGTTITLRFPIVQQNCS